MTAEEFPKQAHEDGFSHFQHMHYNNTCAKSGNNSLESSILPLNSKIISDAEEVAKTWIGYRDIAIAVIISANSINIKLDENEHQRCNLQLVLPAGQGKTSFLDCLYRNNPDMFVKIPEKPYESLLLKKGNDFFDRKVIIHSDMAIGLGGLRIQQLEQLIGFFTALLSDGVYSREHEKIEADCCAVFGMALSNFRFKRRHFLTSTYADRFLFFVKEIGLVEKRGIVKSSFRKHKMPEIKLPYHKEPVNVKFIHDGIIEEMIIDLCIELDKYEIMSSTRAKNFIILFMKSNALYNGRKKTSIADLEMYKVIHPYIKSSSQIFDEVQILKIHLENGKTMKDICKMFDWSQTKFYRLRGLLKDE